jgi:hypothetical protein
MKTLFLTLIIACSAMVFSFVVLSIDDPSLVLSATFHPVDGKDNYMNADMDFASKVPRRTYATTLNEQLEQLKADEQLR